MIKGQSQLQVSHRRGVDDTVIGGGCSIQRAMMGKKVCFFDFLLSFSHKFRPSSLINHRPKDHEFPHPKPTFIVSIADQSGPKSKCVPTNSKRTHTRRANQPN